MILPGTPLATGTPLSPTKKRTLFSRLPLSEPTIIEKKVFFNFSFHLDLDKIFKRKYLETS
jgi:hypothetical protein